MLFKQGTHIKNILRGTGKGGGNEVEILLYGKGDVLLILIADEWKRKLDARHINTLMSGDIPPVNDGTENIRLCAGIDPQLN